MTGRPARAAQLESLALVALQIWLALLALAACVPLERTVTLIPVPRPLPLWDEAAQGYVGLQVADALRSFNLLDLLRVINQQVVWPPLHGLMLAPMFLLRGPGFEVGAQLSGALLPLVALFGVQCAARLSREQRLWITAGLMLLLWTSPIYRGFATLGMLEVPGAFVLGGSVACHLAALWHPQERRAQTLAAASTAALMLIKYNYGLLWIAALAIFEWFDLEPAARRALGERLTAWLATGRWRAPLPLIIAAWAALLVAIRITGGFDFALAGTPISMHSPGNPAYGLLVFVVLALGLAILRDRAAWRARWQQLSPRHQQFLTAGALPLLLWFLIPTPNRVRALVEFSINRASGPAPWSLEGLLYYPRAVLDHYSAHPVVGVLVLLALLIPPRGRPRDPATRGARLVWIAALTGLALTTLHRYHDPRFLFPSGLLLWLNAARASGEIVGSALRPPGGPARAVAGVAMLACAVFAIARDGPASERARALHDAYRSPASLLAPVDAVLDAIVAAPSRLMLLGASNAVSPALLAWRARQRDLPLPAPRRPFRPQAIGTGAPNPAHDARVTPRVLPAVVAVAILPGGASPLHASTGAEVRADSATAVRLASDSRMLVLTDTLFEASGMRVQVFQLGGPPVR